MGKQLTKSKRKVRVTTILHLLLWVATILACVFQEMWLLAVLVFFHGIYFGRWSKRLPLSRSPANTQRGV